MKTTLYYFNASLRSISCIGLMALASIVSIQALPIEALAESDSGRDQFPGRRQGGGTHVVLPDTPSE